MYTHIGFSILVLADHVPDGLKRVLFTLEILPVCVRCCETEQEEREKKKKGEKRLRRRRGERRERQQGGEELRGGGKQGGKGWGEEQRVRRDRRGGETGSGGEGVRPLVCETGLTSAACVWVYASVITRRGGSWRLARYPLHTQKTQTPLVRRSGRVHRSASCDSYVSHCAQHFKRPWKLAERYLLRHIYMDFPEKNKNKNGQLEVCCIWPDWQLLVNRAGHPEYRIRMIFLRGWLRKQDHYRSCMAN